MDAEINAAVRGGLKYWAFCWYPANSSLRVAWNLYQSSAKRDRINWCGIVGLNMLGSRPFKDGTWKENVSTWLGYMRQSNYQKISVDGIGQRPLLYILWDQNHLHWFFDNDPASVRIFLGALREGALKAGLGNPYVVVLYGAAALAADFARAAGADAISSYVAPLSKERLGPYRDLDVATQAFWHRLAETGLETIPVAMVSWDTRPRVEHPVPWDHRSKPLNDPKDYFLAPTPAELAGHFRAAVQFIREHPKACASNALLIYSWDECDEGGGLVPTLQDPSGAFLAAISPIIS